MTAERASLGLKKPAGFGRKNAHRMFFVVLAGIVSAAAPFLSAWALPQPGDMVQGLTLQSPADTKDVRIPGIEPGAKFSLQDIQAALIVFQVIGVYCPQCHVQAPEFLSLLNRLRKSGLDGKVAVLAMAAGGTPMEVAYLHQQGTYGMPICPDPDYQGHKKLAEPQTPFTMILTPEGEVLYAHLGIIEDMDQFFHLVQDLAEKY